MGLAPDDEWFGLPVLLVGRSLCYPVVACKYVLRIVYVHTGDSRYPICDQILNVCQHGCMHVVFLRSDTTRRLVLIPDLIHDVRGAGFMRSVSLHFSLHEVVYICIFCFFSTVNTY